MTACIPYRILGHTGRIMYCLVQLSMSKCLLHKLPCLNSFGILYQHRQPNGFVRLNCGGEPLKTSQGGFPHGAPVEGSLFFMYAAIATASPQKLTGNFDRCNSAVATSTSTPNHLSDVPLES